MSSNILVNLHPAQHYHTIFNKDTGFFGRIEEKGWAEPFWSKNGPELLDISITNWCDKECKICYRNSNKKGNHISLENYESILKQAREMGVLQVALGGGNPNQHPEFIKILEITRDTYDIVPSYTTNGRGLTSDILKASKNFCGAVAVSAYWPFQELRIAIDKLIEFGIKTNIHFVLSSDSIDFAIKYFLNKSSLWEKINAIVFLNYKPVGKFKNKKLLLNESKKMENFFKLISTQKYPFKIGFDSCCVSGIAEYLKINPIFVEPCEAGRFAAFISEGLKMFPCSFMINSFKGADLRKTKMLDVWRNDYTFKQIRNNLRKNDCNECNHFQICLGGCPVFKEINLCSKRF